MSTKQAAILAGGLGTRLRPLTHSIPKGMAKINGKPFLEYQLEYLLSQNVRSVLFLTGHLHEQIEEYFGENFEGMELEYSAEKEPLGTGGALKNAQENLNPSFFLLNGDTYLPIKLASLDSSLSKNPKALATLSAYSGKEKIAENNLLVDKSGRVISFGKSPSNNFVDAGVSIYKKEALGYIKKSPCSLEQDIYPALISSNSLYALKTDSRFYDIGTFPRLRLAEKFLKAQK